ncbi:MAG TPA: hypothetical protein VGE02_08790 [Gemmatimonadales bacterium]
MTTNRALLIGCNGGVGNAVLSLLENSEPGRLLRQRFDDILLADRVLPHAPLPLSSGTLLPPTTISTADDLARLVAGHGVTQVVDLSSIDTVDCTRACDELGADFMCTSVEEWPGRGSIPTDDAIARLLPPRRDALPHRSHLVGSGANPGIVNALVFAAIEALADIVGVEPTAEALDLHSILITEEDTTEERGWEPGSDDDAPFAMTWSPLHCLEELFEPRAFAARDGRVVGLGHAPTERLYRARCGDRMIDGMAVPHEEIATLARRFPGQEIAFIYRLPPAARRALAEHAGKYPVESWPLRRLCPPWATALTGEDRVGVLLGSRRHGELWLGFETGMEAGLALGTNATQLQVAAGVIAGWTQLGRRRGIHFVEDLDWRAYLDAASAVLGPPVMVHDPAAREEHLEERALGTVTVG